MNPPLPITFPVKKKSITSEISAVLMKRATDCFYAKEMLNFVLFEIFSRSTIKW